MKSRIILLLSIISIVNSIYAQNYQTVEEVNTACSQLGFAGDEDAEIAVDRILDQIGLFRNFTIQECPDINNAVAKNIEISPGHKERYILYDASFFKSMDDKANSDWAAISILAHEIGHHLNGHALNDEGSNHQWELEADYFSGISLAKMGASLEEAQSAIKTLKYEKSTRTHPAKIDRLNEIERGWNKGKGNAITQTTEEENRENSESLYRKGEQAFQDYQFSEAITYFNQAKDLGNVDAYYYLSYSHFWGLGVLVDYKEAYVLARKGYDLGSIPATYQLGFYLDNGFGVNMDEDEAKRLFQKNYQVKWFKDEFKAYKTPLQASNMSLMFKFGYGGVEVDEKNALIWVKHAASLGDLVAQFTLGINYVFGDGVELDYNKGYSLCIKAAENGLPKAQFVIGGMYYQGIGVKVDNNLALYWWKKAARNGDVDSQESLTSINETW